MQGVINGLRQAAADAGHLGQVVDAGAAQLLQTAEACQQQAAPLGAELGDMFQRRGVARLLAPAAMASDGKAVGLVADVLDQV